MRQVDSIAQGQPVGQSRHDGDSFSGKALLHSEQSGGSFDADGTSVPYSVRNDDVVILILVGCAIAAVVALSRVRNFVVQQFKTLFYRPSENEKAVKETKGEMLFMAILALSACLIIGLLCYFYCLHFVGTTFALPSNYLLIAVFLGWTVVYFIGKILLASWVNQVFFGMKKNEQWMKAFFFLQAIEGVLMQCVVLLWFYFGLSLQATLLAVVGVVVLVKMLSLGKCLAIFFDRKVVNLHFFLYFCALEVMPLLVFWSGVTFIGNNLKIIF